MNEEIPQIDLGLLKSIFQEYKDVLVAVISIFGVHRAGKSFLLNILCQYLVDDQPSKGLKKRELVNIFHWKGGAKADTTGIHITNKAFMLENDKGERVAVFLMDTQGSFDQEMTASQSSFIAALSTYLSSVQIYNLPLGIINEVDLQHLEIFLNHARTIMKSDQNDSADTSQFQSLIFLLRNWQITDYKPGSEGGMEYLQCTVLNVENKKMKEENKVVREKIKKSFVDVRCHLLPHPGMKVTKQTDSDSDKLKLSDLEEDFLDAGDDLAKCLFSKDKLIVKQLNGKPCTGELLIQFIEEFKKRVESGQIPKVNTILKNNEIVEFHEKILEIQSQYEQNMAQKINDKYIGSVMLEQLHEKLLKKALEKFEKYNKFAKAESLVYQKQMKHFLETAYKAFQHENNSRKEKEKNFIVEKAYDAGIVCLREMEKIANAQYLEDVSVAREKGKSKAVEYFETSTSKCDKDLVKECEKNLNTAIKSIHKIFVEKNAKHLEILDAKLEELCHECMLCYKDEMDKLVQRNVGDTELELAHQNASAQAIEKFNESEIGKGLQRKEEKLHSLENKLKDSLLKYKNDRELQKPEENKQLIQIKKEEEIFIRVNSALSKQAVVLKQATNKYMEEWEFNQVITRWEQQSMGKFTDIENAVSPDDALDEAKKRLNKKLNE
ncbi:atlastin-3-like [Ciona intestinalis]